MYIASAGGDNRIKISYRGDDVDVDSFAEFCSTSNAHSSDVNCVRWNPNPDNADLLVSTGDDGLIKLWRLII